MAMTHQIKPGDIVQLKSGGPYMTVYDTMVEHCIAQWFTDEPAPQLMSDTFYYFALNKVEQ